MLGLGYNDKLSIDVDAMPQIHIKDEQSHMFGTIKEESNEDDS